MRVPLRVTRATVSSAACPALATVALNISPTPPPPALRNGTKKG
jgi:hypothetical protein